MILRASVSAFVFAAVLRCGGAVTGQVVDNGELYWDIAVEEAEYLGNPCAPTEPTGSARCLFARERRRSPQCPG